MKSRDEVLNLYNEGLAQIGEALESNEKKWEGALIAISVAIPFLLSTLLEIRDNLKEQP